MVTLPAAAGGAPSATEFAKLKGSVAHMEGSYVPRSARDTTCRAGGFQQADINRHVASRTPPRVREQEGLSTEWTRYRALPAGGNEAGS